MYGARRAPCLRGLHEAPAAAPICVYYYVDIFCAARVGRNAHYAVARYCWGDSSVATGLISLKVPASSLKTVDGYQRLRRGV